MVRNRKKISIIFNDSVLFLLKPACFKICAHGIFSSINPFCIVNDSQLLAVVGYFKCRHYNRLLLFRKNGWREFEKSRIKIRWVVRIQKKVQAGQTSMSVMKKWEVNVLLIAKLRRRLIG